MAKELLLKEYGYVEFTDPKPEVNTWTGWVATFVVGRRGIRRHGGLRFLLLAKQCRKRFEDRFVPDSEKDVTFGLSQICAYQHTRPSAPGYLSIETTGDARLSVETWDHRMMHEVEILVQEGELLPGDRIAVHFGDRRQGSPGIYLNHAAHEEHWTVRVDCDGSRNFVDCGEGFVLTVRPRPASHLELKGPSIVAPGMEITLSAVVKDEFGNIPEDYTGTIRLIGQGAEPFTTRDGGCAFVGRLEEPGAYFLQAEDTTGLTSKCHPLLVKEPGEWSLYWGDIHGHSIMSDAFGTPDQYYEWGRDVEHFDFCALTDHAEHLDQRLWNYSSTDPDANQGPMMRAPQGPYWHDPGAAWAVIKYITNRYNEPGRFVTLVGFEWTSGWLDARTSMSFGNTCVYYLHADGPIFSAYREESDTPRKLAQRLTGYDTLLIPHHTAAGGLSGTPWELHCSDVVRLAEMYSNWGCSEGRELSEWRLPAKYAEGRSLRDALEMGYRIGFTGGSDTHHPSPGQNREAGKMPAGMTGLWASGLTRQDIFFALKHRRCYATSGENIILRTELNGAPMGSEIEDTHGERTLEIAAWGTAEIRDVVIIKNGREWKRERVNALEAHVQVADDQAERDTDYYYVRIEQADGERAWASPVWVSRGHGAQ